MKIPANSLLYLIAIVLALSSLPAEWFDLQNVAITITSPFGSTNGGTMPEMSVSGLNGFFKPFGFSIPIWVVVLISEIGLLLSLCRSMRFADAPRTLCIIPLAVTLAVIISGWVAVASQPMGPGKESTTPEIGMFLCTVGLILGLGTMLMTENTVASK